MKGSGWCLLGLAALLFDTAATSPAPNGSHIWNARRLYDYLLEDYKTSLLPINDSRETVTVHLDLKDFWVEDLGEKTQVFILAGHMSQTWTDAQLAWKRESFGNLNHIYIPISELWYPDITILNSKDVFFTLPNHHVAFITYTGEVFWDLPVNSMTHCQLELWEFPFDEHVCKVVFASWSHSDLAINLTLADLYPDPTNLLMHAINENLEWELVNVTVAHHETGNQMLGGSSSSDVTYEFTIKRRMTVATRMFVGPSVILCLLIPVVFLLPPGSGAKMMFGIGVLIADTLLFVELIDYIPTAHPNLPFIAKYFLANIVMVSLSLAISAIIMSFWDKSTTRLTGPPAFFRLIVLGPVATILCVKKDDFFPLGKTSAGYALGIIPEGEDGTESTTGVDPGTERKHRFTSSYLRDAAWSEWRQLAVVFDRLFFVIYCVIIVVLTLSFARYI